MCVLNVFGRRGRSCVGCTRTLVHDHLFTMLPGVYIVIYVEMLYVPLSRRPEMYYARQPRVLECRELLYRIFCHVARCSAQKVENGDT